LLRAATIAVLTLLSVAISCAADLKQQTVDAWDAYIQRENAEIQQRADDPSCFLWVDQQGRSEEIKDGAVLAEPVGKHEPLHATGGLIHHWIGAVFIPNATIPDVLDITRDYTHYKDFYKPGVGDADLIHRAEYQDDFTIRFVNNSVLADVSLVGTYTSKFYPISKDRWYSVSETTSMREIKNFGTVDQVNQTPGHGAGFIWRLYSTARLEARDGGVVVEIEAIALSRDVPGALRWFVDPIVRRVSRDSLKKSLTDTANAVHEHAAACARESANRIIDSGTCSRYADRSSIRYQKLARNTGR
jgi:hypothetical protein